MTNICLVMKCLRPDGVCVPYAAARGTTCKGPGADKVNVSVSEMLNCVIINTLMKRNKVPLDFVVNVKIFVNSVTADYYLHIMILGF